MNLRERLADAAYMYAVLSLLSVCHKLVFCQNSLCKLFLATAIHRVTVT